MHRFVLAALLALLLPACGEPGRPLALEIDGSPVKLSEATSSWDHGILSLHMLSDPIPDAADDETGYHLRIDISEPYELDDQTLALSGTAVIEGWDCGPTTIGFIREDESHPRIVRAAAWRTTFLCDASTPFSQSVEGVLDIYEVTGEHITGSIDVTVEPLGGSDPAVTTRFHGRFDSR